MQILVQSVDGALIAIDDTFILFKVQLSDFFIPGPLGYSPSSNSVVVSNSQLGVECYSMESLKLHAASDIDIQKNLQIQEENKNNRKVHLKPNWTASLGE